jgi:hypothetical protein
MAPLLKWSPDFLFREVPGPCTTVRFLYPSRQVALAFLFGAGLGGALLLRWPPQGVAEPLAAALCMVGMGALSLRSIWQQRVLLVDPETRILRLLQRSPFRRRQQTLAFSELRLVHLLDPNPASPNPERCWRVSLLEASGTEIFLGRESRSKAITFGRRLSALIGIPVERSMLGT